MDDSMRVIKNRKYNSYFNEVTGEYLRTGILENGKDTGVDPFMAEFPELLDVGIMGHCIHGTKGLCVKAGIECYQNGLTADSPNMTTEDFRRIAEECSGKTFQIALGGCGDPDQHEQFEELLKICRENGIVPNFTTSGLGITDEKAEICANYCGAVAVSWYRSRYTLDAVQCLLRHGIKTNIHYVLAENTIDEALSRLGNNDDNNGFPQGINAVIFLLHKPVGQGSCKNIINPGNDRFRELIRRVDTESFPYKIGFDSCTVPALVRTQHTDLAYLDTCEGGRWSAYISADMAMMPCSFAHEMKEYAVSLREHSIKEVWDSKEFDLFRDSFRRACPECKMREQCMGGCPILPEIVPCEERRINENDHCL